MNILKLVYAVIAHAFTSWALREINPLHPDLPKLVLRDKELHDDIKRLFTPGALM